MAHYWKRDTVHIFDLHTHTHTYKSISFANSERILGFLLRFHFVFAYEIMHIFRRMMWNKEHSGPAYFLSYWMVFLLHKNRKLYSFIEAENIYFNGMVLQWNWSNTKKKKEKPEQSFLLDFNYIKIVRCDGIAWAKWKRNEMVKMM